MSRSQYVWVVLEAVRRRPVAAFTVKYELSDWLKRYEYPDVEVWRLKHTDPVPVQLDPQTLDPIDGRDNDISTR